MDDTYARKILFRGKRVDTGEWVYGLPFAYQAVLDVEGIETWDGENHRIDPSTVGQYIGLTDKNGNMIFEGDLIVMATSRMHEIKFADGGFFMEGTAIPIRYVGKFTIAGNRWDNPELIWR